MVLKAKSNCFSFSSSALISFWSMSKPLFFQFRDFKGKVPVVGDGKTCGFRKKHGQTSRKETEDKSNEPDKTKRTGKFTYSNLFNNFKKKGKSVLKKSNERK